MKRLILILFIITVFLIGGCSSNDVDSYESASIMSDSTSLDDNSISKIENVAKNSNETITSVADESTSDLVFYQEYGFCMTPDNVPNSEHEKELLCRFSAAVRKFVEEAPIDDQMKAMPPEPELTAYLYNDFDNNGTFEMFATECSAAAFGIWFIDDEAAVLLSKSVIFCPVEEPLVLELQNSKFVVFKSYGDVSSTRDYMYGVRDGIPYETNISKRMIEGTNQYGEVLIVQTTHDIGLDGTGRSWKPYYFYMDENGMFKEYGGIEASLDYIYSMNGLEAIMKKHLPESAEITSIYYRNNGIVNVNYIAEHTDIKGHLQNCYITLRFDGTQTCLEQQDFGVYLAAYIPELADFPASLSDNT